LDQVGGVLEFGRSRKSHVAVKTHATGDRKGQSTPQSHKIKKLSSFLTLHRVIFPIFEQFDTLLLSVKVCLIKRVRANRELAIHSEIMALTGARFRLKFVVGWFRRRYFYPKAERSLILVSLTRLASWWRLVAVRIFRPPYFRTSQWPPLSGPMRLRSPFCFNERIFLSIAVVLIPIFRDNSFLET